jgi:hypothetical protein
MFDPIPIDSLVPPAVLIILAALSAWATLWRPHVGVALAIVTTSLLYLAALPVIAAIYMAFTLDSAYQHARGRGGMWKGRAQANLSEL